LRFAMQLLASNWKLNLKVVGYCLLVISDFNFLY
jgi:hypothetical protein